MNKRQLTIVAARQAGLTQDEMRRALDALLETITQALLSHDQVTLAEFGRFGVQEYPARELRRFDGQGQYTVPAYTVPVFRSSKALRRRLREGT